MIWRGGLNKISPPQNYGSDLLTLVVIISYGFFSLAR